MRTEQIETITTEYLKKKNTQYALLINGKWGSGKTFFWKTRLNTLVTNTGLKTMYISLNGVNDIEKLEQQLFIQLLPKLGQNQRDIVKNLTTVSRNLANATSKFFFKSDLTDIAKGTSIKAFNFNNYCICLDDLERCKIPIDELFGYLSDFVEHKKIKCLILADEPKVKDHKINSKLLNGYDAIKEKIVGRILNYEPELEAVIPELINGFVNQKAVYKFLKVHEVFIISIFKEQNVENLRIVNFFLETLATIHIQLKSIDEQFVKESILFSAIISIEFKKGKLTSKDSKDFKGLKEIDAGWYSRITSSNLTSKDKDKPKQQSYAEQFYLKYLSNQIELYHFYPSLYHYILSGFFSEKIFKAELKTRKPEEVQEHIKSFRLLLNYKFRELSDEMFNKLVNEVYANSKEGIYWMYDYKQITNFYIFFSEKGLIKTDIPELKNVLLKGLEKSAKRKEIHQYTYENLRHFKNENPETQFILDEIIKLHREIQSEMDNEFSKGALNLLKAGNKEEIATFFQEHKFKKELLPFINPSIFMKTIVKAPNEIVFLIVEIFRERYDYSNPGEFMGGDLDFLKEMAILLKTHLSGSKELGVVRKHNFENMLDVVELSISKIEKTIKIA
ncbi:MAG: P-loop NTPase fold protein [Maribacter litoralis]|uniref:P-loop NTPase fold protein n=1 Tax=Maribacter litoralis TaxID=2059726 RepID=UPI003298875D